MSLIDLDLPPQVRPRLPFRRHRRILTVLAAGSLLLALGGEPAMPREPLSPQDRATFCPMIELMGAAGSDIAVVDDHGTVLRIIRCPVQAR